MSSSGLPAFLAASWRQVSTNVSREMTALKSYAALKENAESGNGARLHVRVGRAAFQRDGVDHTAVDIFKQLGRPSIFCPRWLLNDEEKKLRRNQHADDNQRVNRKKPI